MSADPTEQRLWLNKWDGVSERESQKELDLAVLNHDTTGVMLWFQRFYPQFGCPVARPPVAAWNSFYCALGFRNVADKYVVWDSFGELSNLCS